MDLYQSVVLEKAKANVNLLEILTLNIKLKVKLLDYFLIT